MALSPSQWLFSERLTRIVSVRIITVFAGHRIQRRVCKLPKGLNSEHILFQTTGFPGRRANGAYFLLGKGMLALAELRAGPHLWFCGSVSMGSGMHRQLQPQPGSRSRVHCGLCRVPVTQRTGQRARSETGSEGNAKPAPRWDVFAFATEGNM